MEDLSLKWVILLAMQLAVGGLLVWFSPENVEGASTLGIALLSSAFGQSMTAQLKAVNN